MPEPRPGAIGSRALATIVSLASVVVLLVVGGRDPALGAELVDENNVVEWLQVVLCFAAAVLAFRQARAARRAGRTPTFEVAVVGAMAIICIGEVDLDRMLFGT